MIEIVLLLTFFVTLFVLTVGYISYRSQAEVATDGMDSDSLYDWMQTVRHLLAKDDFDAAISLYSQKTGCSREDAMNDLKAMK